jgi:hypothetical protein
MLERLARDRHPEVARVGEVDLRLAPRRVHLREVDLPRRPLERTPLAHPPLERPHLARRELPRVPLEQPLEEEGRLEHTPLVADQKRLDLAGPHARERVRARPPVPRSLRLRRQQALLPLPPRPLAHPRRGSRRGLGLPLHPLLPQPAYLLVRDHAAPPRGGNVAARNSLENRQF